MLFQPLTALLLAIIQALASALPLSTNASTLVERTDTHRGRGTVYNQFGAYGSCGDVHADNDFIAAISNSAYMHNQGNNSPSCDRRIRARNVGSSAGVGGAGHEIEVVVADTCRHCGEGDVDFSEGAWNALTDGAEAGVFWVEW